jgi:hypothetical protein
MIIQPGLTQTITDVIVPAGQYISIGNVGNDATTVSLEPLGPLSYEYYTEIASLSNSAEMFGPYPVDRTVRITSGLQSTAQYDVGAQPTLRDFPPLTIGSLEPVSLVEPAATFVTLTYDDDAGDVKLVSAGVHGLTNAVSQGYNRPWASIPYDTFIKKWRKAKADAGLEKDKQVVPHILRHTCATRLGKGNLDPLRLQQWMGHSSLDMTRRYTHLGVNELRKGIDLLEA